jgi:hypothetical protein
MIAFSPSPSDRPFHGLWSLCEMAKMISGIFELARTLGSSERTLEQYSPSQIVEDAVRSTAHQNFETSLNNTNAKVFPRTKPQLQRLLALLEKPVTYSNLTQALLELRHRLEDDLESHDFYAVEKQEYYLKPDLFGIAVFNSFPSANEDISEAGTCLALGRATACVMHLMRAVEVALGALATAVGVTKQNDWGAYLREIGKTLDRRAETSGARSDDEQFYAEAAHNFDRMRRAWRNPTMHPEKTYSPERAEEILQATKSFMAHLATRISEVAPDDPKA